MMFQLPSLNCLAFIIVLFVQQQVQTIRSTPTNLLDQVHIETPNVRKISGMSLQQLKDDNSQVDQLGVFSDQLQTQNQNQQMDLSVAGKESSMFTSNSQAKVSQDQSSGVSLFTSTNAFNQQGGKVSSKSSGGKTSTSAGAKTSFSTGKNSSTDDKSQSKEGISSIATFPVSVSTLTNVSLQTQINGQTLTLRPAKQSLFSQTSFDESISDLFFNSILPVDTESKSGLDSSQGTFVPRSPRDIYDMNNRLTCPKQQLAKSNCPFSNGESEYRNVTEFYNHLVGSCNHFALSGALAQSSLRFYDPYNLAETECCSKLQKMWEDSQMKQVVTYCSCSRDFKCTDNFREWGVLGPFQGSSVQDLLNYCSIELDSASVTCY